MLKEYFDRSDRNFVKPVYTLANVNTLENCVEPECNEETVEKDFAQSVRLKNSEILTNPEVKLGHLTVHQKEEVHQLMREYTTIFPDVPKKTNASHHDVIVGDASPIKQHPYRLNPIKLQYMRKEIQYMLENDIIEPSNSDWSSPCILVPKPDGTYRLCTDFRKVNSVTKTDSYPIPRIDDCIDKIGSAKFVSKFDLLKGYWQVPLTERAREISAFATPDGLYQYQVMPFGMKNAPATFQRMIHSLLNHLEGCEAYIDDVIIYSDTWDDYLRIMRTFFDILAKANLTVNLAKSEFCHATVEYLGHKVGQGFVTPIMAKVEAISKFPIPTNKKEIMRFLGMAGFYRKFCPNFSSVVGPLTNLFQKRVNFAWTNDCDESFKKIKCVLMNSPVLSAPNFDKQFKLTVDASDVGIGAALFQENDDGVDRVVYFLCGKAKVKVKAHRFILKNRSQVFNVMLGEEWSDDQPIVVKDVEGTTFLEFLRYLYADDVSISTENVVEMRYAARKYLIDLLADKCIEFVNANIDSENACTLLERANICMDKKIFSRSLSEIEHNTLPCIRSKSFLRLSIHCMHSITESDELNIDETTLLDRVMKWRVFQCSMGELPISCLHDVIKNIRFSLIDVKRLQELFKKNSYLDDIEQQRILSSSVESLAKRRKGPTRVLRFSSHSEQQETTNGQLSVSFSLNEEGYLHGIILYGTKYGEDYFLNVVIKTGSGDTICCSDTVTCVTSTCEGFTDILLPFCVLLTTHTRYKIFVSGTSESSTKGIGRIEEIMILQNCLINITVHDAHEIVTSWFEKHGMELTSAACFENCASPTFLETMGIPVPLCLAVCRHTRCHRKYEELAVKPRDGHNKCLMFRSLCIYQCFGDTGYFYASLSGSMQTVNDYFSLVCWRIKMKCAVLLLVVLPIVLSYPSDQLRSKELIDKHYGAVMTKQERLSLHAAYESIKSCFSSHGLQLTSAACSVTCASATALETMGISAPICAAACGLSEISFGQVCWTIKMKCAVLLLVVLPIVLSNPSDQLRSKELIDKHYGAVMNKQERISLHAAYENVKNWLWSHGKEITGASCSVACASTTALETMGLSAPLCVAACGLRGSRLQYPQQSTKTPDVKTQGIQLQQKTQKRHTTEKHETQKTTHKPTRPIGTTKDGLLPRK
ncbi:hypothetical protein FSP39_008860 [Pinctada imbricata]|uniref:Reverse transcriptase domain-containing protein n=1 Tax=Pinctada imbricata TaxID=66713 RepID=A0AA89BQB0_PINIB|nr:hypothetical protein FSP39_008860 [Pinctada imbricata]